MHLATDGSVWTDSNLSHLPMNDVGCTLQLLEGVWQEGHPLIIVFSFNEKQDYISLENISKMYKKCAETPTYGHTNLQTYNVSQISKTLPYSSGSFHLNGQTLVRGVEAAEISNQSFRNK